MGTNVRASDRAGPNRGARQRAGQTSRHTDAHVIRNSHSWRLAGLALLLASMLIPPPLVAIGLSPAQALSSINDVYLVDQNCCVSNLGGVIRVDSSTGAQTVISSGGNFVQPTGIAISD